jgi:putative transposase
VPCQNRLIIYIDGMHFGEQCVLAAVGVDVQGHKHVLALREGATENAEAAKDLLEHLASHGINPARRRLFVIDGSKALRAAWRLNEKEGLAKFRQIAGWLEHDYPDAARSLLEGLEECFIINRLDVPRSLHRCLATSNVVDNPHSPGSEAGPGACAAGVPACRRAGRRQRSWRGKRSFERSWAFAICGP